VPNSCGYSRAYVFFHAARLPPLSGNLWPDARIAYRRPDGTGYAVPLWPPGFDGIQRRAIRVLVSYQMRVHLGWDRSHGMAAEHPSDEYFTRTALVLKLGLSSTVYSGSLGSTTKLGSWRQHYMRRIKSILTSLFLMAFSGEVRAQTADTSALDAEREKRALRIFLN
jgi:hypothetical protein